MRTYTETNAHGETVQVTETDSGHVIRELKRDPLPAPSESSYITKLAFRRRFTDAERASIEWAAVDRADQSDAQRMQAATLRSKLKDQEQATIIDLDDPDVSGGAELFEAIGLLDAGRASEIVNASIQPNERP